MVQNGIRLELINAFRLKLRIIKKYLKNKTSKKIQQEFG